MIWIDAPGGLLPAAHRVIAHLDGVPVEECLLDLRQVVGGGRLELGRERARPDGLTHLLDDGKNARSQQRSNFLQSGCDGGAERAESSRSQEIAAHEQRDDLGQREQNGQPILKAALYPPEAAAPIRRALVIDGKAGFLQRREIPPDRAHRAAHLARGVFDHESTRPREELQQPPVPSLLASAGHWVRAFCVGLAAASTNVGGEVGPDQGT